MPIRNIKKNLDNPGWQKDKHRILTFPVQTYISSESNSNFNNHSSLLFINAWQNIRKGIMMFLVFFLSGTQPPPLPIYIFLKNGGSYLYPCGSCNHTGKIQHLLNLSKHKISIKTRKNLCPYFPLPPRKRDLSVRLV